jgi:hypothetical protein
MSQQAAGATPGVDRLVQFFVGGQEFRLRRPRRWDHAEILRRYTAKLMRACPPLADFTTQELAKDILNSLDGGNLLSEARFEVLLLPRPNATDLGERPPAHWIRELKDPDGNVITRVVAFDDVELSEFDEAAQFVDQMVIAKKKDAAPTPSSSDSAAGLTKG